MNFVLSSEFQSSVNVRVASGAYPSEQAVLQTAFALLERREKLLAQIEEGDRQLRAGEFTEYGDGDVERFVNEISAASKTAHDIEALFREGIG